MRTCSLQVHKKRCPPNIPSSQGPRLAGSRQPRLPHLPVSPLSPLPTTSESSGSAVLTPQILSLRSRYPRGSTQPETPERPPAPLRRPGAGTGRRSPSLPACSAMVPEARKWGRGGRYSAVSAQLLPPPQTREDLCPGRERDAPPTAPGEDQTAPGTGARPPTPRPADARPRP